MSSLNEPQPLPLADGNTSPEVWPLVFGSTALAIPDWLRADMRERHELGVKKYGTPLRVWNGRDPVVDAYQEALDLVVYATQALERLGSASLKPSSNLNARLTLDVVRHTALQAAVRLGELARLGKVPARPAGAAR